MIDPSAQSRPFLVKSEPCTSIYFLWLYQTAYRISVPSFIPDSLLNLISFVDPKNPFNRINSVDLDYPANLINRVNLSDRPNLNMPFKRLR